MLKARIFDIFYIRFYSVQLEYTTSEQMYMYSGIFKDSLYTIYETFKNRLNSYILWFMLKIRVIDISFSIVKLNPYIVICNKWPLDDCRKPFVEM